MYDANFLGVAALVNPSAGGTELMAPGGVVPRFTDVTGASGLLFTRAGWDPASTRYAAVIGGGAGVADVDLDGWEDVVLTGGEAEGNRLFLNQRDGTFLDATESWGLEGRGLCNGVAFGDYDNDGDPDLAIACLGDLRLYRNEGTRFLEVARDVGLDAEAPCGPEPCLPSSLGWLDLENDGDLDLYVVNHVDHLRGERLGPERVFAHLASARAQPALLFRNDGGSFAEVAAHAGVANEGGKGLGVLVTDFDRDGFADLYVANDLTPNRLYRNQGDSTFLDIARDLHVDEWKSSMGVDAGDVDLDGDLEVAVTNVLAQGMSLFRKEGAAYERRTHESGLASSAEGTGWGVAFFDPDLDGDPDLAQAVGIFFDTRFNDRLNQFFLNAGGRFVDATVASGVGDAAVSRALLAFDYDRDGDEDLLVANTLGAAPQLLRNEGPRGKSLQLLLQGTQANRDAVGAFVEVQRQDGVRMVRAVRSACSYEASCPLLLTFGLGAGERAEVTVHWPGPQDPVEERFGDVGPGRHLLVQGRGAPAVPAG